MVSPILLQELPHPAQRQILAGLFNTFYILVRLLIQFPGRRKLTLPRAPSRDRSSQLGSFSVLATSPTRGLGEYLTSYRYNSAYFRFRNNSLNLH